MARNPRVIVIDQDQVARSEVQKMLALSGFAVLGEAGYGIEAVSPVHGEVLTTADTCGKNFGGRLALALRPFGESGLVASRAQWADDGSPPSCAALLGLPSLQ